MPKRFPMEKSILGDKIKQQLGAAAEAWLIVVQEKPWLRFNCQT